MTNYKKIILGVSTFFISFIAMYILNLIIPTLITVGETLFSTNTDIEGIIYFGAILIWILIANVLPSILIIHGLREGTDQTKTGEIIMGIIIFIFGLLFTRFAWYMVSTFTALATGSTLLTAIFWIGLTLVWIETIIVVPAYLIIKNVR